MGSFSWYASDTKRAIRSDNPFPVYALRPDGEPLLERDYEGYGRFGGQDIYDLVADWNREYLSQHPYFEIPKTGIVVSDCNWYELYADLSNSRKDIEREMREMTGSPYWEYRYIGIEIACGNHRNFSLPYPIKLVEHPVPYPAAAASKDDPGQGWGEEDRYEGEDCW